VISVGGSSCLPRRASGVGGHPASDDDAGQSYNESAADPTFDVNDTARHHIGVADPDPRRIGGYLPGRSSPTDSDGYSLGNINMVSLSRGMPSSGRGSPASTPL
jgi:hypothetical protein